MTNILKTVNKYITQNISGLKINNDLFPDDTTEGVISIHDPATRKTAAFIDGTSEYQINISYTARYKDAKKARSTLESILELLDGARLSDSDDGLNIKLYTVANVQFIATDNKNASFYTCSLNCIYTKN